jgi:hypothetical protein
MTVGQACNVVLNLGSVFICSGAGPGLWLCMLASTPDCSIILDSDSGCTNTRGERVPGVGAYERDGDSDLLIWIIL